MTTLSKPRRALSAALLGLLCLAGAAEAGPRWRDHGEHGGKREKRIERLKEFRAKVAPIRDLLRKGEAPSVSVAAGVQVGSNRPVAIEQDADVNIGSIVQFRSNAPAALSQSGTINIGRIIQRD